MPPLVYLDVCCLKRPFDDQSQPRIRIEAEAVREVLRAVVEDRVRARELESLGLGAFDALHLTAAECGGAGVLLTTDDRFLRRAGRLPVPSPVRVLGPVTWVSEELTT